MEDFFLPDAWENLFSENGEKEQPYREITDPGFLKFILTCVPAFIHIRDQQTGKILWCNDEWERAFGITKDEVIHHSHEVFKKIIHPDDLELMRISNEYYQNGATSNFGGIIRVKYPGRPDWRWLIGISRVISLNAESIPLLTLAVFMDFSEVIHTQRQVQLALRDVLSWHYKEVLNKITSREKQVIRLIAKGLNNKQIAEALYISHHTVESHRKNIRMKLRIKNNSELISYLKEIGI